MAISLAKVAANRRNAEKSTGPRTSAGKAVAAMNAVRHGLLSECAAVLPTENRAQFETLVEDLHDHLTPIGPIETELVARIAALTWRLRRCGLIEAGIFAWHQATEAAEQAREARLRATTLVYETMRTIAPVIDSEGYAVAEDALQDAREAQRTPAATLALAFRSDETAFATLSRYEAILDARLAHALAQLERLQETRAVRGVISAPLALAKRTHP